MRSRKKTIMIVSVLLTMFGIAVSVTGVKACMNNWICGPKQAYAVKDGQAQAVIVKQMDYQVPWNDAIYEFRDNVHLATGVTLPIVSMTDLSQVPADHIRILIGPGMITESLGIDSNNLGEETYRLARIGSYFVLTGNNPDSIMWAVSDYLDRYMGVRWLWPGEAGTYVPRADSIVIPEINVTKQPDLARRILKVGPGGKRAPKEGHEWARHHMLGDRSPIQFGHAFMNWWERYGESHPDYFAVPPAGKNQMIPSRIKFDVSNPAVDEAIIQEWNDAGQPEYWNVSPNDGTGFCVSPSCLAMDVPANPPVDKVWSGEANLTARYVTFWNRLLEKMKLINPNVKLATYAYSAYREPPPADMKFPADGVVIGIVHSYREAAYEAWEGWANAQAKLLLRPNWWHTGAVAPYLPLHETGEFFIHARENGMYGFDFDSIMGYWGTQGANYYVIARLSARPDLTVDDVISEYTSAFGSASSIIEEYLRFWEAFTEEVDYTIPGDQNAEDPGTSVYGLYETTIREHGLSPYPLLGSWYVIPYLYTDELLDEARAILIRAKQAAADDGASVLTRIQFLEDGLLHLELTRDVIAYGFEKTRPEGATKEQYIQLREQLDALRSELNGRHVIWANALKATEEQRKIPTHESRTSGWQPGDSDGEEEDEEVIGY